MKKILVLITITIFAVNLTAQKSKIFLLDSLFTALQTKDAFNGNVLIAEKGKVILEKSYGIANEATKAKLNLQTKFELASVSKQFTAMGIVLLVKKGKLRYDDKISKYFPELAFYGDITVRNLLHHTGGLPDYMNLFEEKWDKSKIATNKDIVQLFAKYKPAAEFKSGEKYEYSNTGYALLGLIIEKVSKNSYGAFLEDNIFRPLKMKNTFVYRSRFQPKKVDNYATGYVLDSIGEKINTDSFGKEFYTYYLDGIVGDGMVNSTVGDLLLWDRALYTDQLVDDQDKTLIFGTSKTMDGEENGYGFGWAVADTKKYGKIVNHSGGWAGYSTFIERQLTNDKTIILLQNNSLPNTIIPAAEVRKILYNEPIIVAKTIKLTSADLDKYLGVYSSTDFPLKIKITKRDNILYTQATGQGEIPMDAYEDHTFTFEPANIKIVFDVEKKSFLLTQSGMKINFTRE